MNTPMDRTPTAEAYIAAKLLHCSFLMLGKKQFVLLDHSDAIKAGKWRWMKSSAGYAVRRKRKHEGRHPPFVSLHCFIAGSTIENECDHINRVPLDCRRLNLRDATKSQNGGNRPKPNRRNATSRFKGVSRVKGRQRWLVAGAGKNLGRYDNEEEAARAYNAWASKYFGEFAYLNPV